MKQPPLVSLIMANYNNGNYIDRALKSALSQTYDNWEVIVVDDGSTDHSLSILKEYENHPRIHIYYSNGNRGVGYTKRKCVGLTSGEICAILDSDDELIEHAVESIVQAYVDNPDAVMVIGGFEYYDESMETLIRKKWFPHDIKKKSILEHGYAFGWDTFLKSAYERVGGYDQNQTAEDQDLYFKMEEVGEVVFLDSCLYKYRQHEDGISKKDRRLAVRYDHLMAMESANRRRQQAGDPRILDSVELSRKWEDYYLKRCHMLFDSRSYGESYRSLWNAYLARPSEKLFLKLNLLIHPLKFWHK